MPTFVNNNTTRTQVNNQRIMKLQNQLFDKFTNFVKTNSTGTNDYNNYMQSKEEACWAIQNCPNSQRIVDISKTDNQIINEIKVSNIDDNLNITK